MMQLLQYIAVAYAYTTTAALRSGQMENVLINIDYQNIIKLLYNFK